MQQVENLTKIYVNNGGDIALYLAPEHGNTFTIGVVGNPDTGRLITKAKITAGSTIGGIASSGWRGRSYSLGIADCVTVFAKSAALADAAATMIANKIDLPFDPAITRQPASQLSPDSDLGDQLVTTGVGALSQIEVSAALDAGEKAAQKWFAAGLFNAEFLSLNDQERIIGWPQASPDKNLSMAHIPQEKHRSTHA